ILDHALEPLKKQMTPAARDRLHKTLSILYGIEAYAILKDMWGMGEKEIEKTVLWMADALIAASVREQPAR
ncbi:MAG TPA: TetR/AcrR family transcriptional regulator, partial [Ramlibacter sp.]|nr:TetR/AcrR family transcriptional regulator [Ramlibacter sp.]